MRGLFLIDFAWHPYVKSLQNWNPLRFYVEEAMWITILMMSLLLARSLLGLVL